MSTLVFHPHAFQIVSPGESWVVLCSRCVKRREGGAGPALFLLSLGVTSGCCHDCGGGFCMCRGALECDLCPRRNTPVVVDGLSCFRFTIPPAAPTLPVLAEQGDKEDGNPRSS